MRSKFLSYSAAIGLIGCAVFASAQPANARYWHGGGAALAAGVIGGAFAAATSPLWAPGYYGYYPGYAYEPAYDSYAYMPESGSIAYCEARFRSYDPASQTYLGYDGLRHPCP